MSVHELRPFRSPFRALVLLSALATGSVAADAPPWWHTVPPDQCDVRWADEVSRDVCGARDRLQALLDAVADDPGGLAGVCWISLRASGRFHRSLADLLAALETDVPRTAETDRFMATLVDPQLGARPVLCRILTSPQTAPAAARRTAAGLLAGTDDQLARDAGAALRRAVHETNDPSLLAELIGLLGKVPEPETLREVSKFAANDRSGPSVQIRAVEAFVEACRRAARDCDLAMIEEAERGLESLRQPPPTAIKLAAELCVLRWVAPDLFLSRMSDRRDDPATWRLLCAATSSRRLWVRAVWHDAGLRSESPGQTARRVIDLLADEPADSPAALGNVLFTLTEREPRWVFDTVVADLCDREKDVQERLRASRLLAMLPDGACGEASWEQCNAMAPQLIAFWGKDIERDVVAGVVYRAVHDGGDLPRWVAAATAAGAEEPALLVPLVNAEIDALREATRRAALGPGKK